MSDIPTKRFFVIKRATWVGPDDDLELSLIYEENGAERAISFKAGTEVCADSTVTLDDISEDVLFAHLIMASVLSTCVPSSTEWSDSLTDRKVHLTIGDTTVKSLVTTIEQCIQFNLEHDATADTRTIEMNVSDMLEYKQSVRFQLNTVPGALKSQYSIYVHDYPSSPLTSTQKDNMVTYLTGSTYSLWA